MSQNRLKDACVKAFKRKNKQDAERLLPQVEQVADIRTGNSIRILGSSGSVSLLHLAVQNGWIDTVIGLITKYKCDTNDKDSKGCTPLHYAVSFNHLEVVRYFINERHCDQ